MNEKIKTIMGSGKMKVTAIVTCSALVLSLGAVTAFAASAEKNLVKNEAGVVSYSTDDGATWTNGEPAGYTVTENEDGGTLVTGGTPPASGEADSLMTKVENGVAYYSNDGGDTWSQTVPNGVTVNEDGSISQSK